MSNKTCYGPGRDGEPEGCENSVRSRGLCGGHYDQKHRNGYPLTPLKRRRAKGSPTPPCPGPTDSGQPCGKPVKGEGLCAGHLRHFNDGQELQPLKPYGRKGCAAPIPGGCELAHHSNGYCQSHNRQFKAGKPFTPLLRTNLGLSDEEAASRIAQYWPSFSPTEPYPGRTDAPWKGKCLDCGKDIEPRVDNAPYQGPCGYCAGRIVDEAEAVALMRAIGLRPLVPFPGVDEPWLCECEVCYAEVKPNLSNVKGKSVRGGCDCTDYGINLAAPGYFYVVTSDDYVKCGIANEHCIAARLETHRKSKFALTSVLAKVFFDVTRDAKAVEDRWVKFVKDSPYRVGITREYVLFHDEAVSFALALASGDDLPDAA